MSNFEFKIDICYYPIETKLQSPTKELNILTIKYLSIHKTMLIVLLRRGNRKKFSSADRTLQNGVVNR